MILTRWERRLWGAGLVFIWGATLGCWATAAVTAFITNTDDDASTVGAITLLCAAALSPWLVLPISLWPSRLARTDGETLWAATTYGLRGVDLALLKSADARTLVGRGRELAFVSLRDSAGGHVVLTWTESGDELRKALRAAVERSQARVTERAAGVLGLASRPPVVRRVQLGTQSAAIYLALLFVLLTAMVRIYLGGWLWEALG